MCGTMQRSGNVRDTLSACLMQQGLRLQVDNRIIRYVFLKREPFKPLPTTYKVARLANKELTSQQ